MVKYNRFLYSSQKAVLGTGTMTEEVKCEGLEMYRALKQMDGQPRQRCVFFFSKDREIIGHTYPFYTFGSIKGT